MKKKIINGLLMAAMLFTATTSFVSCKDNVDDELVAVYKDLKTVEDALKDRLATLEDDLETLEGKVDKNTTDIANLTEQMKSVKGEIGEIKSKLGEIDDEIKGLKGDVGQLKEDLGTLKGRLDTLENETLPAMKKEIYEYIDARLATYVKSIETDNSINRVLGTWNIPGINVKALAAFYGDNMTSIETFPVKGKSSRTVYPDDEWHFVAADEMPKNLYQFDLSTNIITDQEFNAGKLIFTVNTEEGKKFDYKDYELSLESSIGKTAPLIFTQPKPSKFQILWGTFKTETPWLSDTAVDEPQENGLYETDVTINTKDLNPNSFGVKSFLELNDLKDRLKKSVENIKSADGKTAKAIQIGKEVAQLVQDIYKTHMSGYEQNYSNPTWTPLKLVMKKTVTDSEGNSKTIRLQGNAYDILATAVKPMSYNSFYELELKAAKHVSFQRLESAIARIAEKIKSKLPSVDVSKVTFKKITTDGISFTDGTNTYMVVNADGSGTGAAGIEIEGKLIDPLVKAINDGIPADELNELIQNLGKVNGLGTTAQNAATRINDYINAFGAKIITALNTHQLTRALAPCIFFEGEEHIDRLQDGLTIKKGIMEAYMSSPTEELLAPAVKKFIAVKKNGILQRSEIFDGTAQKVLIDLSEAGEYTIVFSAVNYYGYIVTKRYKLHVE